MLLISLSQGVLQSQVIIFRRLHVAAAPFTVTPFFSVLFVGIKNSRSSCNSSNVTITNPSNKAVPVILSAPFIY